MKKGGILYDRQTLKIMSGVALVAPLLLFVYGLLIVTHVIASDSYRGIGAFIAIVTPWLAFSIYQFTYLPTTPLKMATNVTLYHIFAGLFVLFVVGTSTPFLYAWALFYLACYVYFSYFGLFLSVSCFVAVVCLSSLLTPTTYRLLPYNLAVGVVTLLVAIAAIVINHVKDIDRKVLDASKRGEALQRDRTTTLINNLADAVISTNEKGIIEVYNAAALNLLDTNAGLNGKSIDSVLKLTLDNAHIHLLPLLHRSRSVTVEDGFTTTLGGEEVRLELTYAPIRGSHEQASNNAKTSNGYVIIIRDVTKAKSLEEERDEFISVVSHELRTPIAVTEGAIDNARLIFDSDTADKEAVAKTLTLAHDQVIFLSKMVNDLSTLSRAERGVADSAEVINVVEMAHSLHADYSEQAKKKGLAFDLSIIGHPGNVNVSRLYLQELLQNFITNAIKYTKEGRVSFQVEAKKDGIHFSVEDTGIGISKTDQAKIFQKFYRAEDYRTRETSGTGLGLYVAVKLAKKLGTTITVKSRLNHGSIFSFVLPPHAPTTTHPVSSTSDSRSHR